MDVRYAMPTAGTLIDYRMKDKLNVLPMSAHAKIKKNVLKNPLVFIEFLRWVVDGGISPIEGVKAYHTVMQHTGIEPQRSLQQDLQLSTRKMSYS